jgi:hypothetical protein
MSFKTISSKDIVYENDKITKIEGINFEKGKIIFDRSLTLDKNIEDDEDFDIEHSSLLSDSWKNHLKNIRSNFLPKT